AARNLISANHWGLRITGSTRLIGSTVIQVTASSNVVQGNYIGTDISGTAPLPNEVDKERDSGIVILPNASGNTIGASTTAAVNTIAFNRGDGVLVDTGIFNPILTNSIHDNDGLGIDLVNGGNHNQPAPSLSAI